ncbi:MAG: response regulator, partial [Proteobacteria bacterium]
MSSDTIYGAVTDAAGQIWLSGNAGLMVLDPASGEIRKTFHREHGLQGEEFNFGAYHRTLDGRLCFGGPGGFNLIDPATLGTDSHPPRVALMRIEVLGAPLRTERPFWLTEGISLGHRDNVVSFDFASLDFVSPGRNRLSYRIPGLADRWIDLGSERRVTLTNLDAGDHVLEVRAINADAVASEVPLQIGIHKRPAPWASGPAWGVYGLLVLGTVLGFWQAQRRKVRRAEAEQRRLEAVVAQRTHELRESNRQLIDASEAKSSFLARMGHELRTPMNGVVGMSELLARSPLSPLQARQTQTIRSSAQALLRILNDLLDLSKAQAGRIVLERIPFDMTLLLEDCAALFSSAAEDKGIALVVCPPSGPATSLVGDPLRLRQVLMNLIGNAVKFTQCGEVTVTCDVESAPDGRSSVNLRIRDTGIGLAREAIGKIFEPFSQADETMTRRFGGTGLGLSICRELMTLMGGDIQVESEPGVGSTFVLSFPLETKSGERLPQGRASEPATVVVVTRQVSFGQAMERYLSQLLMKARVLAPVDLGAGTGGAACVIVDAAIGAELTDSGLELLVDAPIMLAGNMRDRDRLEFAPWITSGAFIDKPLSRSGIEATLGRCVERTTVGDRPASRPFDESSRAAGRRVLVVEDDPVNAAVAQGYLEQLGHSVVHVVDGESAVVRCATESFDLVLMDLNMPGLDGYAT